MKKKGNERYIIKCYAQQQEDKLARIQKQREHITSMINQAFENNQKSILYPNDLYPTLTKELEQNTARQPYFLNTTPQGCV